ncbi:hypothetical protein DKM44_01100 [Deinococcus irradiatisoli]|uniref:Uncharacterized protein n=1 Tax=Deinococcus irradiatisoli TaxID=2202254 RepID=A0A2Z3JA86_9DEIO|nr:hypothetical protein [Deinococcus irradiatisoli]AWN22003.1 hypothetical protein DKM44_01100 [Deinococcus irradiatisoli]
MMPRITALALAACLLGTAGAGSNCVLLPALEKALRAAPAAMPTASRSNLVQALPVAFGQFKRRSGGEVGSTFVSAEYADARRRTLSLSLEDDWQGTAAETLAALLTGPNLMCDVADRRGEHLDLVFPLSGAAGLRSRSAAGRITLTVYLAGRYTVGIEAPSDADALAAFRALKARLASPGSTR